MKTTRNIIVLSGIAILLLAMVNTNMVLADKEPVGAGPGDDLQVYFLKKTFDFCDDARETNPYNDVIDMYGGAVPDGMDVQTAGCVDRWVSESGQNQAQDRRDNYAFTGEQIGELVVARDLDGAIAITHAILQVDGSDVAYCNDVSSDYIDNTGAFKETAGVETWRGHEVWYAADGKVGILEEYPPQKSESTTAGYDARYDKIFECVLTVTDDMDGSSVITVEVTDSVNGLTASTDDQTFFFNPEVSLDISLSSGTAIEFEDGYAGDLVYSTNKLLLENAAEGGVDIAVWLGGTDLTSPDMAAKCPVSNVLDVDMQMEFRCNLDNGLYIEQTWQQVENKNIKEDCEKVSTADKNHDCLGLEPLFANHENVLENGHEADCSFKLQYPVPCIGEFTDGNLIILMRAI